MLDGSMSNFKIVKKHYNFSTRGEIDFIDLTDEVQETVSNSGIRNGFVHVFAPHATGILILTENDYALLNDIKSFIEEIVPKQKSYQHPSNAHSHLRSMLLPPMYRTGSCSLPVCATPTRHANSATHSAHQDTRTIPGLATGSLLISVLFQILPP